MDNTTTTCPAGALLDTWSSYNWCGGIQLETIQDMKSLAVRTENSLYEITVICGRTGDVLVRGGTFFPEFTAVRLAGSSLRGSFLKVRGIYPGFNLEIHSGTRLIVTSRVRQISVL
jgi:hypothetical protein